MVDATWMVEQVKSAVPDAEVYPTDLNGGGDHWHLVVVSDTFADMRSFRRQKVVLPIFTPHIQSGAVHALDMKCMTKGEVEEKGLPKPFVPHQAGEGSHPNAW